MFYTIVQFFNFRISMHELAQRMDPFIGYIDLCIVFALVEVVVGTAKEAEDGEMADV